MHRWILGITGGSGYVGSSLARHFSRSFDVKLLDIRKPEQNLGDNVIFQECDVRNYKEVESALENVDLVIHTAIIQIPAINENKKRAYEVNFIGTCNVCHAVEKNDRTQGLILSGSWHNIGERGLKGVINEEFGFRPDKVENRARLYALSKMAQESIVRFYDEMTSKIFGIIRMGTVLGEGMPEKTAANIFIKNGFMGKPLTPFKHSMYRPMLYVDINDICKAYENFVIKILNNNIIDDGNSMSNIYNVYYPEAITIIELAEIVKEAIIKFSKPQTLPKITAVDTGLPIVFNKEDKTLIHVDTTKAREFLELGDLTSPKKSIEDIVKSRINNM